LRIKVLSVLLLLLCLTAVSAFADESVVSEEYGLIQAISEEELLFGEAAQKVTRAEFVDAAVKAFGYTKTGIKQGIAFSDVSADAQYYESLSIAAGYNMISSTGSFRPDDVITFNEAVRVCTGAAGYKKWAELLGGYPGGYLESARQMGILDNINSAEQIDAKTAFRMIFNTLNAPILELEPRANGVDFYIPDKNKGKTILNEMYNIYKFKGIVNANTYTKLGGEASFVSGRLEINGIHFSSNGTYNDLIGHNVVAYYEDDNGEYIIRYMYSKNNEVVTVKADKDVVFSDNKLEGNTEDEEYKIKVGFDYIYNGQSCISYDERSIIPQNGYITLIDNDKDGYFDIVFAYDFKYLKVNNVNKIDGIIRGKKEILDTSNGDCTYLIYDGNKQIQPYDIELDWLLAYAFSKDGSLCTVNVCRKIVSGTVESINRSYKKLVIDGTEYEYGKHFEDNALANVTLMRESDFWLGVNGELVEMAVATSRYSYGYLVNASLDDVGESLSMKVYTQQGVFERFLCSEKVIVNGTDKCSGVSLLALLSNSNGVKPQLIRYYLNNEGKLTKLDLKTIGTELLDKEKADDDDLLSEYSFASSYNYRQRVFYPYFNINNSVIFKIPSDVSRTELFDVDISFADGSYTSITPYDVDSSGSAGAVVYKSDAASGVTFSANNYAILVEKVIETIDDNNDVVKAIYGWEAQVGDGVTPDTAYVEYWIDEDVEITRGGISDEIKSGDLIRAEITGKRVVGAVLDFNGEALEINTGGTSTIAPFNSSSSAFQYQAGSIYSMDGDYMYLSNQKNGTEFDYSLSYLKNVRIPEVIMVYDRDRKSIIPADKTYMYDAKNYAGEASYVVVKQHYLYSNFAIVFK